MPASIQQRLNLELPIIQAPMARVQRSATEFGGPGDFSPLWCGQNPSGCREIGAAKR